MFTTQKQHILIRSAFEKAYKNKGDEIEFCSYYTGKGYDRIFFVCVVNDGAGNNLFMFNNSELIDDVSQALALFCKLAFDEIEKENNIYRYEIKLYASKGIARPEPINFSVRVKESGVVSILY